MATFRIEQPLRLVSRARDGRWLGGVCAGLGRARGIHPAWIRAGFAIAAPIAGVGVLAYLACWLIIPLEGEEPGELSSGWLVALAKACAACLGLVTLAVLAATATLFGFGWFAAALAAATLVAVLVAWLRLGPAWALLPIAGIALPAVAVASTGIQFATDTGHVTVAPHALAPGGVATFRAGLGTLLVDLRHTELPATGTLNVRVQGGVRRTIVALPQDRCVHLELTYSIHPFWSQVASFVAGHGPSSGVVSLREVLHHLARGYSYKRIGVRLDISPRTVESHVGAVLRKLQLTSRHEVTHWAAARGLIGDDEPPDAA